MRWRQHHLCVSRHLEWALWALTYGAGSRASSFQHLGWRLCGVDTVVASQTFRRWKQAECTTISPRANSQLCPLDKLETTFPSLYLSSLSLGTCRIYWSGLIATYALHLTYNWHKSYSKFAIEKQSRITISTSVNSCLNLAAKLYKSANSAAFTSLTRHGILLKWIIIPNS